MKVSRKAMLSWGFSGLLLTAILVAILASAVASAVGPITLLGESSTERVSVASDGSQGNGHSADPSISADGRYVAFESSATNLVAGDTNYYWDIFVHDRVAGITERVSVASDGTQANADSGRPSCSADGRFIAFESSAANLVPTDSNGTWDIFVHDRVAGITERASVASDGTQANYRSDDPSISGDGRYVAFESPASNLVAGDTNYYWDIFVRDRVAGITERVSVASDGSQANDGSYDPSISGDGRYVAFHSWASNLVSSDTNGWKDVFIRDRVAGTTERVSVSSGGAQTNGPSWGHSMSADGRYVAFLSSASNLVPADTNVYTDVFVHDRVAGTTERVSVASDGSQANGASYDYYYPTISADGRYVAFLSGASNLVPGDTNGRWDIFVRDRTSGTTERVSVSSSGAQANSDSYGTSISAVGRYVVFASLASNLVPSDTSGYADVFVRDRGEGFANTPTPTPSPSPSPTPTPTPMPTPTATPAPPGPTERVSVSSDEAQSNGNSYDASVSADSRYVAFRSAASNLATSDTNVYTDIFVRDRVLSTTEQVSLAWDGSQAISDCTGPRISADGRYVAFQSSASNLVPGDTNSNSDVFVRDRVLSATERVSVANDGSQASGFNSETGISADGRYVAFKSYASDLVPGDTNGKADIFVRDRGDGTTRRVSVASDGSEANGNSFYTAISADGRYVAFASIASNLVPADTNVYTDVFVRDRVGATTERVSVASDGTEANGNSYNYPTISADGRYVAFESAASNLVPGDTNVYTDVFVRDRVAGTTELISIAYNGAQANGRSHRPSISADGRYIAFYSYATNLAPGDTNGKRDIFVRDRVEGATRRFSITYDGRQATSDSGNPSISADGLYVAFHSGSSNLVPGDTNGKTDVFIRDLTAPSTGSVVGAVHLQGRTNDAGATVGVVGTYTTTTDASGVFTLSGLAAGVYTGTATMPGYLFAQGSGAVSVGMTTTLPTVTLLGGDANRDYFIDIYDLTLLGASFGLLVPPGNARADINGDGAVNIFDLVLVGANYGQVAPRPWP